MTPTTHDLLDVTLPYVSDNELETLIDARVTTLLSALEAPLLSTTSGALGHTPTGNGRSQLTVSFLERKRRKNWFGGKADEDLIWEVWNLDVTLATPRTETEAIKTRRAMESSLQRNALKIVGIVNRDRDHIPPITTNETNPFPYVIVVNPHKGGGGDGGWGRGRGIF